MRLARALMLIGLARAALNGGTRPFAAPLRRSARRLSTLAQTAVSPAPYSEDALAGYAPARPGDSRRLSAENGLPSNGPNGIAPPALDAGLLAELHGYPRECCTHDVALLLIARQFPAEWHRDAFPSFDREQALEPSRTDQNS